MNYDRPDLLDRLAAEYVLGTLTGPARRRFSRLVQTLPTAAAAVNDWHLRMRALAAATPATAPSPELWPRIESRLGFKSENAGFWQKLRLSWLSAAGSFALGLALAFALVNLKPLVAPPQAAAALPQYVGIFSDASGKTVLFTSSTGLERELAVRVIAPIQVPNGKILEMWAVPEGAAPVPLGVIPTSGKAVVAINEDSKFLSTISKLAVSVENGPVQKGSAPTEVILSGLCAKLW